MTKSFINLVLVPMSPGFVSSILHALFMLSLVIEMFRIKCNGMKYLVIIVWYNFTTKHLHWEKL